MVEISEVVTFGAMPKSKVVFFFLKNKNQNCNWDSTIQYPLSLRTKYNILRKTFCQAALHIPVDVELAQLIYPQINCIIRKHPLIMVYNEH